MAKTIGVTLKLKDSFSKGFEKFRDQTQLTARETKRLQNKVKGLGREATDTFKNFAKGGIAAVGAMSSALAGMGAKVGFSEALDLQGYKMQLETATKDTQKASKIMRDAVNLANRTPFEAGELVQGAAMFESMGMSAKKWLSITGDMAAATNKSFEQATEALIDAQTGELERLKEFGLTKAMIAEKANKLFVGQQVVNNKGQIVNQEKFNEAMIALMKEKYAGGMEAQAKTIKGMWSTVTGVTKSGLATLLGMSTDGSVRTGSVLDLISQKVGELAKTFEKWQTDGTLKQWSKSFDSALKKTIEVVTPIMQALGKGFRFVADNIEVITPLVGGIVAGIGALKIANKAVGALNLLKTAFGMVNLTLKASPLFIIPTLIGGITAIMHSFGITWGDVFTTVIDWVKKAWDKVTGWVGYMKDVKVPNFIKKIKSYVTSTYKGVKKLWNRFKDFVGWLKDVTVPSWITALGGAVSGIKNALSGGKKKDGKKRNATGTPFFAGGLTSINEGGRGETVILPSGTQIIPHDVAKRQPAQGSGHTINVNVNIAGNVIGNRDFAQYVGSIVSKQVIKAVANA